MSFGEIILSKNYNICPFWNGVKRTCIYHDLNIIELPENLQISLTQYYSWNKNEQYNWEKSVKALIVIYEFKLLLQKLKYSWLNYIENL